MISIFINLLNNTCLKIIYSDSFYIKKFNQLKQIKLIYSCILSFILDTLIAKLVKITLFYQFNELYQLIQLYKNVIHLLLYVVFFIYC